MKQIFSALFLLLCTLCYAQDEFLDTYSMKQLKVKAVRRWKITYENGVVKDSCLYEYEYDTLGNIVAKRWNFSQDLKTFAQEKDGEVVNQDGQWIVWYNLSCSQLLNINLGFPNESDVQEANYSYNLLGNIQTIHILKNKDYNWRKAKWKKSKSKRARIEFCYGFIGKDSCSNSYFDVFDFLRYKPGSKEARRSKAPEYRCGFMESSDPVIHRIEWYENKELSLALRYEYIFFE